MEYKGLSVADAASRVVGQLTAKEMAYASDPKRGQYRGFAALHDLMDANMLLPMSESDAGEDGYLEFANAVMDQVTATLK